MVRGKILSTLGGLPADVKDEFNKVVIDEKDGISRAELLDIVEGYDGIIAGDINNFDKEIFAQASNLKIISRFGIGVDNINIQDATKYGVKVTNVPGENAESVAEHTIGLMIAVSKNFVAADKGIRTGKWNREDSKGFELANKKLGQIGFGNIGRLVAIKCQAAFNMVPLVYDPYVPDFEVRNYSFGRASSFEDLIRESDVITINVPLTTETEGLLGWEEFTKMKDSAIVVNTGRGEVIVEDDLTRALKEGEIFGAGLDVFEQEPIPPNTPLLETNRTVFTPHSAAITPETMQRVLRVCLNDQIAVFEGKEPTFLLNPES